MTNGNGNVWSVVLAGGDGTRLRALTIRPCGTAVPKQFCSLHGGRTLLEDAVERAALYDYRFSDWTVGRRDHVWWTRQRIGDYSPVLTRLR